MEYSDNNFKNVDFEINLLKQCKTLKEVVDYTTSKFPKWFVNTTNEYSEDYPQFKEHWESICKQKNTTPKSILFVDEKVVYDSDHRLIWSIAEIFTSSGFSVRRSSEFIMCKVCDRAIPKKELHQMLIDKKDQVPKTWSSTCSGC